MNIGVSVDIDPRSIANGADEDELISFIHDLDREVGDQEFTEELILKLVESLAGDIRANDDGFGTVEDLLEKIKQAATEKK